MLKNTRYLGLYVVILLMLSACSSTDPREMIPKVYKQKIKIQQGYQHSSTLPSDQRLLHALKQRNLVISDTGQVLPMFAGLCNAQLYYRVSSNTVMPSFVGKHRDLLSGFYLELNTADNNWFLIKSQTNKDSKEMLSGVVSKLKTRLNEQDLIILKVPENTPQSALVNLESYAKQLFTNNRTQLITSIKPKIKGLERALIVGNDVLADCSKNADFITKAQTEYTPTDSLAELVLSLPSNADFNQLTHQKVLMSQGQYLTIDAKTVNYSAYLKGINRDSCQTMSHLNPDYIYCFERKQDASDLISDGPFIIEKKSKK
ncbi:hypothetical protein I6F53_11195 [Pseudoalteromonas sp. SWN29]|uniref:hypothetical protein n=1 Tax=Pseudoalteromonas sp. SWN29 TaxID=2792064 RepID=UPI0018CEA3D9|nr:hypothetical protein [Pseudoalteromonas sp. SWN29]MBH0027550.1 hypothetical protein [Pseudoalteromonas sp. SWN29]